MAKSSGGAKRSGGGRPVTSSDITEQDRTEAALRESEERFRALVEFAPVAIVVVDGDGRIVLVNAAADDLFGYDRVELIGQPLEILLPERLRDTHVMHRVRYSSDPQVRPMGTGLDFVGRRKDGTEFPIDCALSFAELAGGILCIAFATDTTDRKRAEEELREREERYRMIVQSVDEVVYTVAVTEEDPFRGVIQFVSAQAKAQLGYEPEDFLGDRELWMRILHPDDVPTVQETTRRILKAREAGVREYRMRHGRTGEYRWFEDRVVPRFDEHGEVNGIQGAARDITERKRTEEALRASEAVLRATMDSTADGVLVVDNQWRVTYINRRFADMWSLPDKLLETHDLNRLIPIALGQVEDPEALETQIRSIHPSDEVTFDTVPLKDGRVFEQYSLPLLIGGEVAGRVVSMRDITARKRAEEAIAATRDELEGKVERQMVRRNPYGLTFREFTVLNLVAAGKADKEIALELGISLLTVHKHVGAILGKMHASSRTDAAARALREGLLE